MTVQAANLKYGEDVLISYLPLSNVAAQVFDIYGPILVGASIYFAQPDALKVNITVLKQNYFVHIATFLLFN